MPLIFVKNVVKAFRINIVGLSNKIHEFDFEVEKQFFDDFGGGLIEDASLNVKINLDKHETFLDAQFNITGKLMLVCDRSLEPYQEPISVIGRILFKYAAQTEEISDDIVHIAHETVTLDLSQHVYDLVGTSIPMKRLHPRFRNEEENISGQIVYTSSGSEETAIDPRWEKLKSLK